MQNDEDIRKWASKSELRRVLDGMRRRQEPFFIFFKACCGNCEEQGFVENILDGVTAVSTDSETIGHKTDIRLDRQSQQQIWIDISDGTPVPQEKLDYCNRHNIDLFELEMEGEATNLEVAGSHIPKRRCRATKRDRLKKLWKLIATTDDAKVGIREDFRTDEEKEKDWNESKEKSRAYRAMAEQGCPRCKQAIVDDNGNFGVAIITMHQEDGRCQDPVVLCTQCDFEIRGGWSGEYPEDAGDWCLKEECNTCVQIYQEDLRTLEEVQKVESRHLMMQTNYGSRMVQEPNLKTRQHIVADSVVPAQELLNIMMMIKFVTTWPEVEGHPVMKEVRMETEKIIDSVRFPNGIRDWDWIEAMGESYIPEKPWGDESNGDKLLYIRRWWEEMPPFPLDTVAKR